jgi:hypothetical protein
MKWRLMLLLMFGISAIVRPAGLDCATCHDDNVAKAKGSVHGGLGCTGCHEDIKAYPHPDKVRKVQCGTCHADTVTNVSTSVHAKAGPQPCLNCHGDAHAVLKSSDPKSLTYVQNLPRTCGTCHGNAQMAKQSGLTEVYSQYMDSIHGFALTKEGLLVAASCKSCHGSHAILSSKNPKSKTNHANIPDTCGVCHGGPKREYAGSIHGVLLEAGMDGAPVCTNCHTAHQISSVRTTEWQMKTTSTCGSCHKEQFATYHDTFHSNVSALGYREAARCWDCHGFHGILPASDPKSTVAKANLTATCGKCHAGANEGFVKYDPHADAHNAAKFPILHYATVFMNVLLWGAMAFFVLHTILWFIRTRFNGAPIKPRSEPNPS